MTARRRAVLNLNYNTHSSIQLTFHFSSQIHLLWNKAKMTALSPKIEEPSVSHICCHTWPTLLSLNCGSLNTLIAPDLPAKRYLPSPYPYGSRGLRPQQCLFSSSNILNHTAGAGWRRMEAEQPGRAACHQLSRQFESFKTNEHSDPLNIQMPPPPPFLFTRFASYQLCSHHLVIYDL